VFLTWIEPDIFSKKFLFEVRIMKHHKHLKYIAFLIIILGLFSCTQKEVAWPPVVEDIPQTDGGKDNGSVIEQITEKPREEETAVTYPRPEKIKKYKPVSKEDSWFLVGGVRGDRAYSVFVDPETIESENGLVNSWSKLEFEETRRDEDGLSYKEVQISSDVNCEKRTYSYRDSKFYDALGRLMESQSAPYEPQPIIEGTVSAKIADFVCGYELNRTE